MSRILRRPMFRGGRVDSRGTGITSGLDRPGLQAGGMPPSTVLTGQQILNQAAAQNFNIGSINPKSKFVITPQSQFYNLSQSLMDPERYGPIGRESNISSDLSTFYNMQDNNGMTGAEGLLASTDDTIPTEKTGMEELYESFTPTKKETEEKETEKTGIEKINTEIEDIDKDEVSLSDVEKAKKEYAELLGIEKARGRDISDMLGRLSAAALRAPSLRDAFADYMEAESKAGPGRAERIQEAAGTLAAKEAIAGKQLNKRIEAALATKQFKASDLQKRVEYLKGLGYKQDTAVRMALKEPASFAEELQDVSQALGTVTNASFQDAARIFYKDMYKGDFDTVTTIKPDKTADVADGVYTDTKNRKVYKVTNKQVTELY